MPRNIISGDPGSTYTNDGKVVLFQMVVDWHYSCALCVQHDHQIGPFWPIPFHRNCRCVQVAVLPGETSRPFVDYRAKILTVSHAQQAAIMGRANLTLVEAGQVAWDDVVTAGRIRSLREVVSRKKLTVQQMVTAGVNRATANEAFNAVNTGTHTRLEVSRRQKIDALLAQGFTASQIATSAASALAARVGIKGPSGPGTVAILPPTPKPPPPAPPIVLDPADEIHLTDDEPVEAVPTPSNLPEVEVFRPVPTPITTVAENATKFPGLTIRPDQIEEYTASSATAFVMHHRCRPEAKADLLANGIDLKKTTGIIGNGLYLSSQDEAMYGKANIKVVIDSRNPLIGSDDFLIGKFKEWNGGETPTADRMRELTIKHGYDFIVWDWGPSKVGNPVRRYWQVVIHPEQCRFVVDPETQ